MNGQVFIRVLRSGEYADSRQLIEQNSDPHIAAISQRFDKYRSIAQFLDPDDAYALRQRIVVGAFDETNMIGTLAVDSGRVGTDHELSDASWTEFWNVFTLQEFETYTRLNRLLADTYIGAPPGALTVHSLAVHRSYRRAGVAKSLLCSLFDLLDADEKRRLYVETARSLWRARLFESVGFEVVRKSFSIYGRVEFGFWGSVLLQYTADTADYGPLH